MNNLLTQNSTCFLANALIFLYYGKMQTIWQEIFRYTNLILRRQSFYMPRWLLAV